jgi:uncharacterized protein (TIGR01777 family)
MSGSILITGATGFIGKSLCEKLREKGFDLIALSRDPERAKKRLAGLCRIEQWDPQKKIPPLKAVEQSNAVVHLLGENVAGRWNEKKRKTVRESRIESTKNLVRAFEKAKKRPEVLISASAVGYYGDRGEKILDENAHAGGGFLSDVCREWEKEAKKAERLGIRVVCIRIGVVLGPDGGALKEMLPPFRLGLGGPLGSGRQWMPWIHRDDLIGIILHVLKKNDIKGAVNGTAPYPVTNKEFTRTLGRILRRPVILRVPAFVLRLLFGEFARFLLFSERVVPKTAQDSGYRFCYETLEPALRDCLK